jgi:hypothetical protein
MNFDELARHQKAIKHFRWMPGMKTVSGARVVAVKDDDLVIDEINDNAPAFRPRLPSFERLKATEELPDLSDPATLGCLLHLVREAWGGDGVFVRLAASGWRVMRGSVSSVVNISAGATEAEALVAALEAAP